MVNSLTEADASAPENLLGRVSSACFILVYSYSSRQIVERIVVGGGAQSLRLQPLPAVQQQRCPPSVNCPQGTVRAVISKAMWNEFIIAL